MDKTRIDEANLFNEARQIQDPARREEFVARACGGDAELKRRVLKLLGEYHADPNYLSGSDSVGFVSPGHHLALAMIGTRIGPYELTSVLGEGGMGVVFLAEQRELIRRKVALKLIKPGMDSQEILNRFSAERQALALMDHPYIARAYDAGTSPKGHPYFVMEYVDGIPITEYCSEKGLNTQERLELFRMTCEAVIHAHQKGVIHRDLKPTNILIAEQNGKALPKVIDFGVAKAINHPLTDQSILTGAGQLLGTLEYMSPEQMNFARQDVDTRTDVYAMGILLYELLTDLKPFDSKALRSAAVDEVCRIIREQEPPRPSARMTAEWKKTDAGHSAEGRPAAFRRLPDDLDWIVMKAIEKDRSRRYDGIGAFAADIDHFLNQEPVSAGPPSRLYRLRKAARRNPGALAAAALILMVLISATVVSLRQALHATRALAVADRESARARKSEEILRRTMYAADMRLATLAWQRNDIRRATELLGRHVPKEGEVDLRGFEWWFLTQHTDVPPREAFRSDKALYFVRLSPSGDRIAVTGAAGVIRILNSSTFDQTRTIHTEHMEVNGLDFSPDGNTLLSCGDDGTVCHWNLETGENIFKFSAHEKGAYQVLFGPDPMTCISCGRDRAIRIWKLTDGTPIHELQRHKNDVETMTLSRKGLLIAGSADRLVTMWNPTTGERLGEFAEYPPSKVQAVACSSKDALVAIGHEHGFITIRRVNEKGVLAHQDLADSIHSLAFSPSAAPEEKTILAAGDDAGYMHLLPVAYSLAPSGLIASDDIAQRGRHWPAHKGRVYSIAFTADGSRLFTAGEDGVLNVWSLEAQPHSFNITNEVKDFAEVDSGRIFCVGFKKGEILSTEHGSPTVATPLSKPLNGYRVAVATAAKQAFVVAGGSRHLLRVDTTNGQVETLVEDVEDVFGTRLGPLAVTPDGKCLVYETHSWEPRSQLNVCFENRKQVLPLDWSPEHLFVTEDHHLLFPRSEEVVVYDAKTCQLVRRFAQNSKGPLLGLSPDGIHLAVAQNDRSVHIWNWRTGEEVWAEIANAGSVECIAFSPDGETIATAGKDGYLRLWRWKQQTLVLEYPTEKWPASQLAFSSDGNQIFVLADGVVTSYQARPGLNAQSSGSQVAVP